MDYMVMEAVFVKAGLEEEKAIKEAEAKAERDEWKKDTSELKQVVG